MFRFIRDLFSRPRSARTIVLLQPGVAGTPRQYRVVPFHAVVAAIALAALLCGLVVAAFLFTPFRGLCGTGGIGAPCTSVDENVRRAVALEDSLSIQAEQLAQLRSIIVGDVSLVEEEAEGPSETGSATEHTGYENGEPLDTTLPRQPNGTSDGLTSIGPDVESIAASYLGSLRSPGAPPVEGIFSRSFDPAAGHYGIDLAADVSTPVHAMEEGVVVLADWTQKGGNTIAIQHPDGYLSIYKHNDRLLRGVGDWVRSRETVALSGNSGEITSGPHLHVELWQGGSPRDPALFLILSR